MSPPGACLKCGCYRVLPHCRRDDCFMRWCARPQCGWEEGLCAFEFGPDAEPHPWELETLDRIPGAQKRWCQPVTTVGTLRPHRVLKGVTTAVGWAFDVRGPQRRWPENELREMWEQLEGIVALPTYAGAGR